MDSPDLLRLGFLLLAVAAPHPNIAMSSDDPAEGTPDTSSEKTAVTVYHCKDCEISTCKSESINFENFEIIAKTQKKRFSCGTIELVTNETHITICFGEASSFPEGLYGIGWEKAGGAGLSCDIVNSGAFSEIGSGNISTEEKKICCEAETNLTEHNPTLKWYTEPLGTKASTPPADIPDNPAFLTSKKNSIGILSAFLFVGVCAGWVTMYYFLRLRRGQAFTQDRRTSDKEHLSHA